MGGRAHEDGGALEIDERDEGLALSPAAASDPVDGELRGLDERLAREQGLDERELARFTRRRIP
jgi:hypothetical protein